MNSLTIVFFMLQILAFSDLGYNEIKCSGKGFRIGLFCLPQFLNNTKHHLGGMSLSMISFLGSIISPSLYL
jgi:hypothetical protein